MTTSPSTRPAAGAPGDGRARPDRATPDDASTAVHGTSDARRTDTRAAAAGATVTGTTADDTTVDTTVDDTGAAKAPEAPKLSLTQVVASALAAVSTTVLLSYFGIAGTIIGAGAASVITVLANYAYTRSIQKTHEQLKPVVTQLVQSGTTTSRPRGTTARLAAVPRGDDTRPLPAARAGDTAPLRVGRGSVVTADVPEDRVPDGDAGAGAPDDTVPGPWFRLIDRYGKGKVLAVSALALFVVVMGVVLVVELAIGKPLSDAVRGQEGSGTSISRTTTADDDVAPVQEDRPSQDGGTPAEDPSGVPAEDPTTEPTTEPSQEPTDAPTDGSTTPTPTPTPEPSEPAEPTTPPTEEPGTGDGTGSETGTGSGTGSGETGTGSGGATSGTGTGSGGGTSGEAEPAPAPSSAGAPEA